MSNRGQMHKKSLQKRPITPGFNAENFTSEHHLTEENAESKMPSGLCGALSKKEKAEMAQRHKEILNKYFGGTSAFPSVSL